MSRRRIAYGPQGPGHLPEAIVVDVPDYCGPHTFYPGHPKWVPILEMQSHKDGTTMWRRTFPIVAGFALTINKSQGLTIKEGTVINLKASGRFNPAAKHGLPFVAFTRSTSFAMTAFKNLPPFGEFQKGRRSDLLRMRYAYEDKLRGKHAETMAKYSDMDNREAEDQAYELWLETQRRRPKRTRQEPHPMTCQACDTCKTLSEGADNSTNYSRCQDYAEGSRPASLHKTDVVPFQYSFQNLNKQIGRQDLMATATSKFGFYPREGDYPVVVDESKSKFDQKIVRFV